LNASLRVVVVAGGPSTEAEVSRASARAVSDALTRGGHRADVVELDRGLPARLLEAAPDVVFPAVHGAFGEDGCLQGLLEVLGFRYVGSGVLASALAMDKARAKVQLAAAGLPLARGMLIDEHEDSPVAAARVRAEIGASVVLKPTTGGSAIGVTRVEASAGLAVIEDAIDRARGVSALVLVEELIHGKEVTCGVLECDGNEVVALPPTLIVPRSRDWYDFEAKYAEGGSEHTCPAPFEPELTRRIRDLALAAHLALGARDLSRTDFIVDEVTGSVVILEVNTLPGMTGTSLFPEAAHAHGIDFVSLCDGLVRRASERPLRPVPETPRLP
jgi:D-alanine-D-alanine ligase